MPQGKGTYGSQKGRPSKSKKKPSLLNSAKKVVKGYTRIMKDSLKVNNYSKAKNPKK